MPLDRAAAIAALSANAPWAEGEFKAGSIDGVVLCSRYNKYLCSFRVVGDGKVMRVGLRKVNSVSAQHIVRTLEAAGFEMVD